MFKLHAVHYMAEKLPQEHGVSAFPYRLTERFVAQWNVTLFYCFVYQSNLILKVNRGNEEIINRMAELKLHKISGHKFSLH
jgi:hypothetical protein